MTRRGSHPKPKQLDQGSHRPNAPRGNCRKRVDDVEAALGKSLGSGGHVAEVQKTTRRQIGGGDGGGRKPRLPALSTSSPSAILGVRGTKNGDWGIDGVRHRKPQASPDNWRLGPRPIREMRMRRYRMRGIRLANFKSISTPRGYAILPIQSKNL